MTVHETDELRSVKQVQFLSDLVLKTQQYAHTDPETALVHARRSAEAICQQVYLKTIGEPGDLRLDALMQKLKERQAVPSHLMMPFRIVQMYGNYAAHARLDVQPIDSAFVTPCLLALSQVVHWYFEEFLKVQQPTELTKSPLKVPPRIDCEANETMRAQPTRVNDGALFVDLGTSAVMLPYELFETFGDLLDAIWIGLDPLPKAFTYGASWWLRDEATSGVLKHAGQFVGRTAGQPVADLRTLRECGILPGARLAVVRAGA